jgi:D-alanyl-D-alanine-carboxypeptidase/D-alanyl-D-alanine-endopeptidase
MPAPPASAPPAPPPSLSGIWLGTLQTGGKGLRLQIHLDLAPTPATCSLDSLDQHAMAIPCSNVVASATTLSLDVPAVHGVLKGTVSADGNTVTGTWTQSGADLPIVLTRQTTALEAAKVATDPAMPAVDIDKIQAVMDKDLEKVVSTEFAPATGVGVTIGVLEHGVRKIFSYGAAQPDSVFEIGSITKTFTGLTLAQMVQQNKVGLDEPVRTLLPKGTVAAPTAGAEITLVDLSAQRSGLPRLPDNMKPADDTNPYADYDAKALYAFLASHGVAMPANPVFGYSNLGVGLLGQALADRAGSTYEALVHREVTGPLGMTDTAITLTPALGKRFIAGHAAGNKPQRGWDFLALVGAGGIRSTAADMLTYLDAQLHPDHITGNTPEAKTLPAAHHGLTPVLQGDAVATWNAHRAQLVPHRRDRELLAQRRDGGVQRVRVVQPGQGRSPWSCSATRRSGTMPASRTSSGSTWRNVSWGSRRCRWGRRRRRLGQAKREQNGKGESS